MKESVILLLGISVLNESGVNAIRVNRERQMTNQEYLISLMQHEGEHEGDLPAELGGGGADKEGAKAGAGKEGAKADGAAAASASANGTNGSNGSNGTLPISTDPTWMNWWD